MKFYLIGTFLLLSMTSLAELTAREIIDEQFERHKIENETTHMTLTLIDRKGFKEVRTLRRLSTDRGNDLTSSLTVFDSPADIKGTALLTRENEEKDNDQWLYFPSQRRMLRIAQARRSGYFMGTDFTYEDMDPENIDDYTYRLLAPEMIDGADCHVIEAVPASKKKQRSSGYGLRKLWVRKDILFTVKIEFFDRNGVIMKIQKNSDLENIHGEVWRTGCSIMDNQDKSHQTEVNIVRRDTSSEFPDGTFTERNLRSGRYLK